MRMMDANPRVLSFRDGTLLLTGLEKKDAATLSCPHVWTWDTRVGAFRADAIHYSEVAAPLAARGVQDAVPAWRPVAWTRRNLPPFRPEQLAAREAWLRERRGVLVMPTGTGKTEVALGIMADLACCTLIAAPVRDLMYQWHQRILQSLGYDAGIVGDNVYDVRPVSVTTYDSACIHMERLGASFQLLVFDECHHLPGPIRRDAARMSAAPWRLGLTATPERGDGRHADLDRLIGPVVYNLPLQEVAGRTLADYDVVRIPIHLGPEEQACYDAHGETIRRFRVNVVREHPDFEWGDIHGLAAEDLEARRALRAFFAREAIEDRAREKLRVLEDVFRLHVGSRVIVFTGSNAMAREVSRRFLVPCLLHHCGKRERLDILEGFKAGTYPVIVANEVLDEGVDVPAAKVAVVIGGQATTRQAKQRLGRILRRQGTEKAVLYEVVTADTRDEARSRRRRSSDAYQRTIHRRL